MTDLHPYDGKTRRFAHDDAEAGEGPSLVARLLGLDAPPAGDGLRYELSFYSGGIGVLDHLAIAVPADAARVARVVRHLGGRSPEEAIKIPAWAESFRWLVGADDAPTIRDAAVRFLDEQRSAFQPACEVGHEIWFAEDSGVNTWSAAWLAGDVLCFLAYDQG